MTEQEQRFKAIEMYRSGIGVNRISRECHVAKSTVYRFINSAGLEHRVSNKLSLRMDVNKIEELARSGINGAEIGRQLGATYRCIYDYCKAHNIPLVEGNRKINPEEFKRLCEGGATVDVLAEHFNINPYYARKYAKAHELTITPKPKKPKNPPKQINISETKTSKPPLGIEPKSKPVKCTRSVCRKCYYGCQWDPMCDFIGIERVSRLSLGIKHTACTQYITEKDAKELLKERKNGRN